MLRSVIRTPKVNIEPTAQFSPRQAKRNVPTLFTEYSVHMEKCSPTASSKLSQTAGPKQNSTNIETENLWFDEKFSNKNNDPWRAKSRFRFLTGFETRFSQKARRLACAPCSILPLSI